MRTFSVLGVCLLALLLVNCAGNIVELPEEKELTGEELKRALTGDDFRRKNAARRQLSKLPPAELVELLKELLKVDDAPTRLMAVAELLKLPEETHRPILEELARTDPDAEIRGFAAAAIGEEEEEEEEEESLDEGPREDEPQEKEPE